MDARTAFATSLLERIRADRHPSVTHLMILEEIIPPELHREYFNVLLEKVIDDNHPSIPMMRRVARLAEAI